MPLFSSVVTMPFFRNLTLQIKTFLGYYDKKTKTKKNKQAKKQCSWELTGQLFISYIKGTIKKPPNRFFLL